MVATACATRSTAEKTDVVPATGNAAELIARAEQLYNERADLAKAREGVAVLRQARAVEPGNYEAAWRLARINYYLGEHTTDSSERDKAFSDGEAAAKDAIKLIENRPEGHFWLGANLGGQAEHSAMTGLAAAEDIRREMQTVIKLDEGFMSGSAYMALARIDLETPPVLGGDPKKAVELLEKGLKFGENNPLLHYYLAEAYVKTGRKEDARKQLEIVINMQPDPSYLPEHNDAVAKARELMKKVQA
jgi:tetratricopeptide (TPR) repeat protein